MSQAQTRTVKLTFIMRSRAFGRGAQDRRSGKTIGRDYDAMPTMEQWQYEFGRQFAAFAPADMPIKFGRDINPAAVRALAEAFR